MGRSLLEKDFQKQITDLALLRGWLVYSIPDSRRASCRGYPDLTCIRPLPPYGFFLAELKTDRGRLEPEQKEWLDALHRNGIEYYIWRPRDWQEIERVLQGT